MIQEHNVLLFQNFYIDDNEIRNQEFLDTLTKNIANTYIDKIILIVNKNDLLQNITLLNNKKITLHYVDTLNKISYETLYSVISEYGQSKDICWWANLDIQFNETIVFCKNYIDSENDLICLSRHEETGGLCINPSRSHDAWCFLYDTDKLNLLINNDVCKIINFGDVNSELQNAAVLIHTGYIPYNPTNKIIIQHNHLNHIREYTNINFNKIGLPMAYISANSDKYGIVVETLNSEYANIKYSHFYYKHLSRYNKFNNNKKYISENISVNLNKNNNAISLENTTTELQGINILSKTYNNVVITNNNTTNNYIIIPGSNYIEINNTSKNLDIIFNILDNNFYQFTIQLFTNKEQNIKISSTNIYHELLMFLLYKSINKDNLLHLIYEGNNPFFDFFNLSTPAIDNNSNIKFNIITSYKTLLSQYCNLTDFPNIRDEFIKLTIQNLNVKNIIDIYLSFNNLKTTYVYIPETEMKNIHIINNYLDKTKINTKFISENDNDISLISKQIHHQCIPVQITDDNINQIYLLKFYLALYSDQFIGFQDDIFSTLVYHIRKNKKDIML